MSRDLFSKMYSSDLNIFMEGETVYWAHLETILGRTRIRSGEFLFDPQKLIEIKHDLPKKPSRVTLILPRQEMLSRTLKLPSPDPEEIFKLIELRLPQEIPYTLNEIVYVIASCRPLEDHNTEIRILWALKSNVQSKLEVLHLLDYVPDLILSSSQALCCAYQSFKNRHSTPETALLLQLDERESELLLLHGKNILHTRLIKKDLAGILETPEDLLREFDSLAGLSEKENFEKPLALLIAGADTNDSFPEWISKKTELSVQRLPSPVKPGLHPRKSVETFLTAPIPPEQTGLSSEDIRKKQQIRRKARLARQILTFGAAFILFSLSSLWLDLSAKEIYKAKLEKFWRELSPDAKKVLRIAHEIKFYQEFQKEKTIPLEFLSSLPGTLPQGISLTQFEYTQETGFQLRGVGDNHESILRFLKEIRKLPYISKADFDFSTRRKQSGREYFEFQISAVPVKTEWPRP
ncbi:MAG TPA: PilN domain-containing protein [Candidatus Omnitrophota bacterium]|nr:PilN domain-containing protein [Candidatus Omnitrophota bacterium]